MSIALKLGRCYGLAAWGAAHIRRRSGVQIEHMVVNVPFEHLQQTLRQFTAFVAHGRRQARAKARGRHRSWKGSSRRLVPLVPVDSMEHPNFPDAWKGPPQGHQLLFDVSTECLLPARTDGSSNRA